MDLFLTTVDQYIPKVNIKNNLCPWFDKDVIHALRTKDRLRKTAVTTGLQQDVDNFNAARRDSKWLLDTKYHEYLNNIKLSLNSNPKKFWPFAKANSKNTINLVFVKFGAFFCFQSY